MVTQTKTNIDHTNKNIVFSDSAAEEAQKQELLKQLKNNKSCFIRTDLLYKSLIIPLGPQQTKNYKNGRRDIVYKYHTAFQHISNITWEEVQINRPETIQTDRGTFQTKHITRKIQKIKEC